MRYVSFFVSVFLENFPLSDLLAETSTGLEASMSNSTSCRYSEVYTQSTLLPVWRTYGTWTGFGQVQKGRTKKKKNANSMCSHMQDTTQYPSIPWKTGSTTCSVCKSRQRNGTVAELWQPLQVWSCFKENSISAKHDSNVSCFGHCFLEVR